MPTYQYACTECAERLEVQQRFTDDALTVCPQCGGRLRKLFNAVGVVFKGSGFYRNDSRAPAENGKAERSTDAGEAAAAKTDGDKAAANGAGSGTGKGQGEKPSGGSTAAPAKPASGNGSGKGKGDHAPAKAGTSS